MEKRDVHNIKGRLKARLKRLDLSKKIRKTDKELIRKFLTKCRNKGLTETRVLFYADRLLMLAEMMDKPLKKMTKGDIESLVGRIESSDVSEWTKINKFQALRKFYQWLYDIEWESNEFPDLVKGLRKMPRKSKLKDPTILTKEEVLTIFNVARGIQEKAISSFMYESGCRVPDELLNMKIGDVEFKEHGATVRLVSGKVGERKIFVVPCVPHLKTWVQKGHPNPTPDNYLWVHERSRYAGRPLSYNILRKMVHRWVKDAGITKGVRPYNLRHTRYTHLAKKWPTQVLYKYMGQTQESKVISHYVRLNNDDIEDTVLAFHGIKAKEDTEIKPIFCSRCEKQNAPEEQNCLYCHSPLTERAMKEWQKENKTLYDQIEAKIMEGVLERLKNNPEKKKIANELWGEKTP